jgi:BlaI family transcriptional regulator, penicillinase repressor
MVHAVGAMSTKIFVLTITKILVDDRAMTVRSRKPTDAELEILAVLWERGPSTVREVAEVLGRDDAYTTVLKLLQIMTEKRLVTRRESGRLHIYSAASSRDRMRKHLVRDLLRRAFDGSAAELVMHALTTGKATREELDEIRRVLDQHRRSRS